MSFEKGVVTQLSSRVRRIVAGNASALTGPGTNTYLIGDEQIAVLDPGPADAEHIDSIIAAGAGKIKWLVATHTHPDHSPAAAIVAKETGADLVGSVMVDDGHQDKSFVVTRNIQHNEALATDEFTLRAIHTPGHVGNHFCFLLEEEGMLFTGDHIMEGSTVVIVPPSGDMSDYLASLDRLTSYTLTSLAPGHGAVMDDPLAVIQGLIDHRMMRENKVVAVLTDMKEGNLNTLTPPVYDDVDESLHPIAQISLWAHLLKLEKDGRVEQCGEKHWAFGEEIWRFIK